MRFLQTLVVLFSFGLTIVGIVLLLKIYWQAIYPCGPEGDACSGNDGFAAEYFAGLVPFAEVLESRRDLPKDAIFDLKSPKRCSYAIVRLAAEAPVTPPPTRADIRGKSFRWGRLTRLPLSEKSDAREDFDDAYQVCANNWQGETRKIVGTALKDPTSYVSGGFPRGEFFLYSAPHQVAVRLRYSR